MPAIFISYASRDQEEADRIVAALEARGLTCWMSSRDVPLGQDYQGHIVAAIEAARVVLVLLSRHSSASKEVPKETAIASEMNKTMIPVRLDASEVTGALRYQATSAQRLDLSAHFEQRIDELARQLAAVLDTAENTERRLRGMAFRRLAVRMLVWPVALGIIAALGFEAWQWAPRPHWLTAAPDRPGEPWARNAPQPQPAQLPAAERVKAFVQRYYAALSGPDDELAGFMQQSVADPVQLYGRSVSRHVLIAEQMAYGQRWPDRSFSIRPNTMQANCGTSFLCSVTGVIDFSLRSTARNTASSGAARFDLRVDLLPSAHLTSISTVNR